MAQFTRNKCCVDGEIAAFGPHIGGVLSLAALAAASKMRNPGAVDTTTLIVNETTWTITA